MKKILFIAVLAIASMMAYAQPRAIGGRVGGFEGFSYQHSIGDKNMIELELGIGFGANSRTESGIHFTYYAPSIQLAATYDWIDPFNKTIPWNQKGEWHWYMGVGAAGGYGWGYGQASMHGKGESWYGNVDGHYNWGFVGAAGRVGVEYDFWFPLQLSIDYRPVMGVGIMEAGNKTQAAFHWDMYDICVGVRYKF